jgi:hypothetical protein
VRNAGRTIKTSVKVVGIVRASQPLYPVPSALPGKLEALVKEQRSRSEQHGRKRIGVAMAVFAATLIMIAMIPGWGHKRFTSFAAEAHREFATTGETRRYLGRARGRFHLAEVLPAISSFLTGFRRRAKHNIELFSRRRKHHLICR